MIIRNPDYDYEFKADTREEAMATAYGFWDSPEFRAMELTEIEAMMYPGGFTSAEVLDNIERSRKRCMDMLHGFKVKQEEMMEFVRQAEASWAGPEAAE